MKRIVVGLGLVLALGSLGAGCASATSRTIVPAGVIASGGDSEEGAWFIVDEAGEGSMLRDQRIVRCTAEGDEPVCRTAAFR